MASRCNRSRSADKRKKAGIVSKISELSEHKRLVDEVLDVAESERAKKTKAAIARGEGIRLRTRADEVIVTHAMLSSDDELLHVSALATARAARDELRAAAIDQAAHLTDFAAAVRLDQAFENLERTERRAARFGATAGVYRREGGPSLFVDLWRASGPRPNPEAVRRLDAERSAREFRAGLDITSSFVPDGFNLSQWSDIPRAERVLAAIVPSRPLGKGRTVKIPKLTASATAGTATDNTTPPQGGFTDEYDSSNVAWIAGQLPVSLQWFEQGFGSVDDDPAEEALQAAYDEALELALFQGPGTTANLLGLLNISGGTTVSYTSTAPSASELLPVIGSTIAEVADARKLLPSAILMRPARWAYLATGTDSANRPFLTIAGPVDAKRPSGADPVGSIFGVPVFCTPGVPANLGAGTNEDAIVVCRVEDLRLYVSDPIYGAYTDTSGDAGSLEVLLSLSGSAAWLPDRRPEGVGVITGTGLIVPTNY